MSTSTEMPGWMVLEIISNSIHPGISVEVDTPHNHPNKMAPVMDMEVGVDSEGKVIHNHYAKPMAFTGVVNSKSGLSTSTKRQMIFNEGLRRLKNCSPHLLWTNKAHHLSNLNKSMKIAGYTESFRITMTRRIISAYNVIYNNTTTTTQCTGASKRISGTSRA